MIRERRAEGIAIANAAGGYEGRKPSLTPAQAKELRVQADAGIAKVVLADAYGISRETILQ